MWHMWHTLSEVEAMEIFIEAYIDMTYKSCFKVTWIISEKFHSKISEQFIMIMMSYTFPTTLDGNTDCSSFFFNKGISRMLLWIVLYYNLQTTLLYYNVYKRPCCTTMSTNDLVVLQSTNDLVVLQCMQCVQYNSHSLLYNTYTIEIY
jgi:hypothetical protein